MEQEALLADVAAFRDALRAAAATFEVDFSDGAVLNAAPLAGLMRWKKAAEAAAALRKGEPARSAAVRRARVARQAGGVGAVAYPWALGLADVARDGLGRDERAHGSESDSSGGSVHTALVPGKRLGRARAADVARAVPDVRRAVRRTDSRRRTSPVVQSLAGTAAPNPGAAGGGQEVRPHAPRGDLAP